MSNSALVRAERDVAAGLLPEGHTAEDDFQHFLSYSGLWARPPDEIERLRMAYEHGAVQS